MRARGTGRARSDAGGRAVDPSGAVAAGRAGLAIGIGSPPPHAARCRASGSRGAARGAVARRGASSEATALVRAGRAAAVAAVLPVLLAGCGADGAPVPPGPPPPEARTGATITGQASLGVAGRL